MFKKRYVLAALLALALNQPVEASAGYVNGWDLLEICKASPSSPLYRLKVAQCTGYVVGVSDTFDCTSKLHGFNWSSTTPGTQSDLVKVTVDWLNNHPNLLNHKSDGLVAAALSEAFPCRLASQ
jgi:hypothetical protein